MKRYRSLTVTFMMLFLSLFLLAKADVQAASKVKVSLMKTDRTAVLIKATGTEDPYVYNEIVVKQGSTVVEKGYMADSSGGHVSNIKVEGLKKNKVYKLYYRKAKLNTETGAITNGKWKLASTFCTAKYSGGRNSTTKINGFWIKAPKVSGIKYYQVYTKKGSQKYKKIGTVKPGKKKKFTKNGKKKFTGGNYYIKIVPVLKKGSCKGIAQINDTYDYYYSVY